MSEKPQPEDFGVSPEQVAAYQQLPPPFRSFLLHVSGCVALALVLTWLINIYDDSTISKWLFLLLVPLSIYGTALFYCLFYYVFRGIGWLFSSRSARRPPVPRSRVKAYLRAKAEYERASNKAQLERWQRYEKYGRANKQAELERLRHHEDYWHNLSGRNFETELARLYKLAGYAVETTSATGDEGADLLIRKDNQLTVVQCKRHNKPLGPATVRELHGTLLHFGGDRGILAATGGFTEGARRHADGKPIELLDLDGILSLQEELTRPK